MTYAIALAICVVAATIEGLCAGRDPMSQLTATRQPRWSPPNWLWVAIGVGWYGICYVALVRLLPLWTGPRAPLILLVALMLANGVVNILQFRMRRLDMSFFFLLPYWLLLAAFLATACPLDRTVCLMFGLYALYQLYAAAWAYQLWKLNPR